MESDQPQLSDETLRSPGRGQPEPTGIRRGSMLGRYVVLERVGQGGMGAVYAAYDPKLDRRVAIKLLLPTGSEHPEPRARLEREALAMARLKHPNAITVHDVGEHDGQVYIAMEFIEGVTLKTWLAQGDRGGSDVLEVFAAAGLGLAAAHEQGIVHRDFKPDNVMVESTGRVVVMDFGLARRANDPGWSSSSSGTMSSPGSSSELTRTGSLIGTPAYMSPEQIAQQELGPASDQFSYCVALHEALYGIRPFDGGTLAELSAAIRAGRRQPTPENVDVPRGVRRALDRGLSTDPEHRFASMQELLDALQPDGARRPRWGWLSVAALVVGGVGFAASATDSDPGAACRRGAKTIERTWNDARGQALGATFEEHPLPLSASAWERTASSVDDWSARWSTTFEAVCSATHVRGEQSEVRLDLRMDCLDQRRAGLEALLTEFESVDDDLVQQAVTAVSHLPSPETCATVERAGGDVVAAADAELAQQLRLAHSRLEAKYAAGRYHEVVTGGQDVLDQVGDRAWPVLRAKIHNLRGNALKWTDDVEASVEAHKAALRDAATGQDPPLVAAAWVDLLATIIERTPNPADAEPLMLPAELAVASAGDSTKLRFDFERARGWLAKRTGRPTDAVAHQRRALELSDGLNEFAREVALDNLGNALFAAGHYDEALQRQQEALELTRTRVGADHPLVGQTLLNLAQTCDKQGHYECARASYAEAMRVFEASVGVDHGLYADALYNVATFEYERLDFEAARQHTQRALAIWEQRRGVDSPRAAAARTQLGSIAQAQGEHEVALQWFAQAEKSMRRTLGDEHPNVGVVLNNRANAMRALGQIEESLPLYEQSLHQRESRLGLEHPSLAFPLLNLADALLDLERAAEALPHAARAVALREAAAVEPLLLGIAYFGHARALWDAGADRSLARRRAQQALEAYDASETGELQERRAAVQQWIAAHGRPSQ